MAHAKAVPVDADNVKMPLLAGVLDPKACAFDHLRVMTEMFPARRRVVIPPPRTRLPRGHAANVFVTRGLRKKRLLAAEKNGAKNGRKTVFRGNKEGWRQVHAATMRQQIQDGQPRDQRLIVKPPMAPHPCPQSDEKAIFRPVGEIEA